MAVYKETIEVKSHGKTPTYIDITKDVRRVIEESGIQNGICAVISPHITCSVFFEEFCHDYNKDGDRAALFNGDAHLKSTLLGSSETFEVDNGKLGVGTIGYVYFADFDRTRPRTRKCKIIVLGE